MGSPVSVVVAEIVMQNIEEQALATYTRTVRVWLRYVDDTFTAVHKAPDASVDVPEYLPNYTTVNLPASVNWGRNDNNHHRYD